MLMLVLSVHCTDPSRIFQQEMLGDLDEARSKQNLLFITERHKDILRLEKSIRELHQLFVDMAALVSSQGELIDQIERSVSQSVEHMAEVNRELDGAIRVSWKCVLLRDGVGVYELLFLDL
jgi:t-SNARE complex subunit (syntaxin)